MPRAPRRIAPLAAAALIALIASAPGCRSGDSADQPLSQKFAALSSGPADSLMNHIERLTQAYSTSEPTSPARARDQLMAYTQAVIDTARAIENDRTAPDSLREKAVDIHLKFLGRRSEVDPQALDKSLAACEAIIAENPKSRLAALAAMERARVIGFRFQTSPLADRPRKMEGIVEAVKAVAELVPPVPDAPDLVNSTAQDAEWYRRPDLAESLYALFLERFPENPRAGFVRGALGRIKLRGQVIPELKGPGLDGAEVSLESFRGKVVLIDFWGTGSPQALTEVAELEMLRSRLEAKGFVLLGVCLDPDPKQAQQYLKAERLDWPQISSPIKDESMTSPLTVRFGVQRPPFKMLVDRDGRLVDVGFLLEQIKPSIDALFPPKDEPSPAATKAP